jgi:putative transposase
LRNSAIISAVYINDAGWGQFLAYLSIKAERAGLMTIAVNPNGTTQDGSGCGQKVPKEIQDRWHSCPDCGLELDRDHNAAINIKYRAVGHPVLKARGVLSNSRTAKREARSLCQA